MTSRERAAIAAMVAVTIALGGSARAEPAGPAGGNRQIPTYDQARRLAGEVYLARPRTLYCDCRFSGRQVEHEECGYEPLDDGPRAHRVEWEHIVPAASFGRSFPEWRDGDPRCMRSGRPFRGRDCARRTSGEFRRMEADLYNLAPAIGEVNARRSDLPMGEIAGEERQYGSCDLEIGSGRIEPRPEIRGDIARTYLYMDGAYPGRGILDEEGRALMEAWAVVDPVDAWECERGRRIRERQGNDNPLLSACAAAQEADRVPVPEP